MDRDKTRKAENLELIQGAQLLSNSVKVLVIQNRPQGLLPAERCFR